LPSLGITGIALGTLTARVVGAALVLYVLARGLHGLALRRKLIVPEPSTAWRIMRIGLPAATETAIMGSAQFAFIWVVAHSAVGDVGTAVYAAHTIAIRVEALSYLPAFAWGTECFDADS